jgi:hypothetical protein
MITKDGTPRRFRAAASALLLLVAWTAGDARAQQRFDERRMAAPDGTVKITNSAGAVRVTGWSVDSVRVTGRLGEEVADVEFTTDERATHVRVVLREAWRDRPVGGTDLEVRVPRSSHVAARTQEGAIEIRRVSGAVDLESATGDLRIHDDPRFVYARSVGGDVEISGISKVMRASSVAGAVTVEHAAGYVELSTVSGPIRLSGRNLWEGRVQTVSGDIRFEGDFQESGSFAFESNSGRIELVLAPHIRADFDVTAYFGRVETELPGASVSGRGGTGRDGTATGDPEHERVFSLNGGGARLNVRTFKGSIRIATRP